MVTNESERINKFQLQEFIPLSTYKNTGVPPTTGEPGKESCE